MRPSGPIPAEIMLITDFPSQWEKGKNEYLSGGREGQLLDKCLGKASLLRTGIFITGILNIVPPDGDCDLHISSRKTIPGVGWERVGKFWVSPDCVLGLSRIREQIALVKPKLIITLGDLPLLLLTGNKGITKWRGSRLYPPASPCPLLVTIHPRAALAQQELAFLLEIDLKRAKNIYEGRQLPREENFVIAPSFEDTVDYLSSLVERSLRGDITRLAGDLETRRGHIACFGIGESAENAFCIPFITADNQFYWTEEQETQILALIQTLFTNPSILWVGQNYLYDCQYFWRFWGFLPAQVFDTMIGHHSLHSNMRKGLDFLSSLYAHDHIYWKDEGKEWDISMGERQYWVYNCKDDCRTWEISFEIQKAQENMGNLAHHAFQQELFFPVLRMMNRGIKLDISKRGELRKELLIASFDRSALLEEMVGHPLNPRSSTQLINFFYKDLGLPVIRALKSDSLTANSQAMIEIANREPILGRLCQTIVELRSLGVFLSTFINAELDSDSRMRCAFSIAGPTTYRFSSSENAFGSGMNLQNIPVGEKTKIKSKDSLHLPNIRSLFIPDEGYTFFDMDLDRADLQVVVWEADDQELKTVLRDNLDLHCVNAVTVFNIKGIPLEQLSESHPEYPEHRGRIGKARRDKTKAGVHATNYGVGDSKLAATLGISTREASEFRKTWFGAHPGIAKWHARTEHALSQYGYIENRFGARIYALGRINLPEFLAWTPQSTVAGVINRALVAIDRAAQLGHTTIQLQIQVHDSLAGQFRTANREAELALLPQLAAIPIPYPDPLIIPVGIKTSTVSWGDCK